MRHEIDMDDAEYVWPPGALDHEQPAPGPAIAAMRLDSIEQRLANLEHGRGDLERYLVGMDESTRVAMDALTYLSGAVERVRVLVLAQAQSEPR
jgi:hypothetical protein